MKSKAVRTTEGMRDLLFDELDRFLSGAVDETHVKAVTQITGSILKTVVVDLEAKRMIEKMNTGRDQNKAIGDLNLNIMLTSDRKNENRND